MRTIEVPSGNCVLHADVEGEGEAVLFLHGQFGTSVIVRPLLEPLSKEWMVITPDLRGRGRSVCPDIDEHNWDQYIDDTLAVLDALRLERVVLGGVSLGAGLALATALRHPERVSALVLYSSPYAGEVIGWREEQRSLQAGVLESARAVREQSPGAVEILKSPKWARHDLGSISAALAGIGFMQPFGALDELEALKMPCMIVPGSDDMHPRKISELYAQKIDGAVWSETSVADFPAALRDFLTKSVPGSV